MKKRGPNLSRASADALLIAARDGGCVIAGKSEHNGCVERVSALTIKSLANYGLVTLRISPDGGMMGQLTETGKLMATWTKENRS